MTYFTRIKTKYGNKRTEYSGRKYHSKLEASYAKKLDEAKKTGELLFYLEQVPIRISPNIVYRIDFVEFWKADDCDCKIVFTETKGHMTKDAKIKIDRAEEIIGLQINIIKKI